MALAISIGRVCPSRYPYSPVEYTPKIKAALVFDIFLITTLIVVGILAIVGSTVPQGNALHGIGLIGKAWGGVMIGGAILIGLIDYLFHKMFTGFKHFDPFVDD